MRSASSIVLTLATGGLFLSCGGEIAAPGAETPEPPPAVSSVQITPAVDSLTALGDTVRLVAAAFAANGTAIVGRMFSWGSSDASVVTVDSAGLVTALGIGRATVAATCEGVRGAATVSVGPLGFVFVEQPSYSGDCMNRPPGGVCLGFSDRYVWLVYDAVAGWGEHGSWDGQRIVSAIGFRAEYYHVLGTNLVFERSY